MHRLLDLVKPARLVLFVKSLALTLGGPGLVLLTFLDSSFTPFPFVADGIIVTDVLEHPSWWAYYAAMATIGSLGGCYVLYALARKGGHAFVTKRLHERHIVSGLETFRRWGLLTVVVPAILPPPMPFKPFVLLVGLADVPPVTFVLAVIAGRGFRYGSEALLTYWYGDAAMTFINRNLAWMSVATAVVVAVVAVGIIVSRRRRRS